MKAEESSQSAELNSDHGDIDPTLGTGHGGFVVAHQSPLAHQPAEGSLHDPAARQDFEALGGVRAIDDLDRQLGAESLDPLGEGIAGVATQILVLSMGILFSTLHEIMQARQSIQRVASKRNALCWIFLMSVMLAPGSDLFYRYKSLA